MSSTGIHPDAALHHSPAEGPVCHVGGGSVAAVAGEIEHLVERLDALGAELARLVRDGDGDARPGLSSLDVMSAAGRVAHAADVIGSLALAQLNLTGGHAEDGARDGSQWAQHHAGISSGTAAVYRRIDRCLERYPRIADAFIDGRLRAFHLAAIDTIIPAHFRGADRDQAIEVLFDIQGELITVAGHCRTEREYRRFCARVRDRLDPDGNPPADGAGNSELHLRRLGNGRWTLYGDLTADDGALIASLLDDRMAADTRARTKADEANAADPDADLGSRPDPAVRRADAAKALLLDGAGAKRPGRVGLFLHLDLDDLATRGADLSGHTGRAHSEANYDICDDTLWGLLADADITPVICDSGTPLSFGRTRRIAPDILRRALAHRTHASGSSARRHAVRARGLARRRERGAPLPRKRCVQASRRTRLHHMVHDDGWQMIPPDDGSPGEATMIRPDGTILDPEPRWQRQHRRRDPLRQRALDRLAALTASN